MKQEPQKTIARVEQMRRFGTPMSEQELLEAANTLAQFPGRREAQVARAEVMQHLSRLGYEDVVGNAAEASPVPASPSGPSFENSYAPPSGSAFAAPLGASSRNRHQSLTVIRLVGAGVLTAAAMGIWSGMAPNDVPDQRSAVNAALSDYQANEARADGAPQQAVVGGWVAKDLLSIMAVDASDSARAGRQASDRLAAEAALLVVGVAFGVAVRPSD